MNKKKLLNDILPFIIFVVLILLFTISFYFSRTVPTISKLNPKAIEAGDVLKIEGTHFGLTRGKSKIWFNNQAITTSFIESWSNSEIKIRVPSIKGSGLLYVETLGGRSEGVLYVDKTRIPEPSPGAFFCGLPYISSLNKGSFFPGEELVLKGENFGQLIHNSQILLSSKPVGQEDSLHLDSLSDIVPLDFKYISYWGEHEVRFILPSAHTFSALFIKTESGYSNPININYGPLGILKKGDEQSIRLSQEVYISQIMAFPQNQLRLWIPTLVSTPSQRIEKNDSNFIKSGKNHPYWVYSIDNLSPGDTETFIQHYAMILNSVEAKPQLPLRINSYPNNPYFDFYLKNQDGLPVTSLKKTALAVIKREKSPYTKAKKIYDYVLWKLYVSHSQIDQSPLQTIKSRRAGAEGYAKLFVTLARGASIPARVVTGSLYNKETNQILPHYWAEVYLPTFGWFPIDFLSAEKFYPFGKGSFGYLDENHISLTRGTHEIARDRDNFKSAENQIAPLYFSQNIFSQRLGNLDSVLIQWQELKIRE